MSLNDESLQDKVATEASRPQSEAVRGFGEVRVGSFSAYVNIHRTAALGSTEYGDTVKKNVLELTGLLPMF